jgi:predicted CXXCH cytochrome family protein
MIGRASSRRAPLLLVAVLPALLAQGNPAAAQLKMDRSKECVICHISWGEGYEKMARLLPPVDHPIVIDGREARVSTQDMCWSCHDGYVGDSRRFFQKDDPHFRPPGNPAAVAASGLPRDLNGEIYCGTCHTPHIHKMEREFVYVPFLRAEANNSALCLRCHSDRGRRGTDHPLRVPLEEGLPAALAGRHVSTTQVECMTCHDMHSPHKARLMEGNDRTQLCRSCHESSFAILQSDHHLALSHPDLPIGDSRKTAGAADACAACHLSHGGRGPAMWAWPLPGTRNGNQVVQNGVDARCLSCHQDKGAAGAMSWVGHGHPLNKPVREQDLALPLRAGGMSCTTCHDPHAWSALPEHAPGPGNEEGTALTSFLRLPDDENGRLCINCHRSQAQTLVSDHNSFNWSEPSRGQCTSCHNTHAPKAFSDNHATPGVSEFTSLCLSCHGGTGRHGATPLGRHGHPLGVALTGSKELPAFRSDNLRPWRPGQAEPADARLLVGCESCHDPHRWNPAGPPSWQGPNARGDDASSFLHVINTGAQLCAACHPHETQVLGSAHDLSARRPGESACRACHTTHRAVSDWAIIASSLSDGEMAQVADATPAGSLERNPGNWSPGARHCLSCHRGNGASQRVPEAWGHPQKYTTLVGNVRPDGRAMPLFDHEGRAQGAIGHVDCTSCHNPHVAHPATGGEHAPDFLRQETSEAICSDCHGDKALWKYRYYHSSDKRVLP